MADTVVSLVERVRSSAVLFMVIVCLRAEYFLRSYLCKLSSYRAFINQRRRSSSSAAPQTVPALLFASNSAHYCYS